MHNSNITIKELLFLWITWKQKDTGEKWNQKRVADEAGILPTYISQIKDKPAYSLRDSTMKKLASHISKAIEIIHVKRAHRWRTG